LEKKEERESAPLLRRAFGRKTNSKKAAATILQYWTLQSKEEGKGDSYSCSYITGCSRVESGLTTRVLLPLIAGVLVVFLIHTEFISCF
jgi:hypothetical protein